MPGVARFSVSLDERLIARFDSLIAKRGYVNRSEAIRDLMRNALVERQWEEGSEETVGTVTLVYNHHSRDLSDKLIEHQHSHHHGIVSTLHIHLDSDNCLEVVVLRGKGSEIARLASELIGTKGVKHGRFIATTTGEGLV